jgi:Sigma-70 region 2
MEATAELIDDLRPRAFAIAYRMLGSVSEAENVVQEALPRCTRRSKEGRRFPRPGPTRPPDRATKTREAWVSRGDGEGVVTHRARSLALA